jgi:hypothetical protein
MLNSMTHRGAAMPISNPVRLLLLLAVSSAASSSLAAAQPLEPFEVVEVGQPLLSMQAASEPALGEACREWSLSAADAERFLNLSEEVDGPTLHQQFNWLPCRIEGRLRDRSGQFWNFEINAAAVASLWQERTDRQFRGCRQADCEPLVLMMPEPGPAER